MARQGDIKWTPKQKSALAKAVKNFNAKIYRQIQKAHEGKSNYTPNQVANIIPTPVTQKELKEYIRTRQDLTNITNMLSRFSRKGAEKEVNGVTRWAMQEAKRLQNRRNREIQKLYGSEKYDPLKGQSQRLRDEGIAYSQTDLKSKNKAQLERYIKTQLGELTGGGKLKKDIQYRESFIKRIEEMEGITETSRHYVIDILSELTPDQMRTLWYESENLHIGFLYPTPGEEQDTVNIAIKEFNWFIHKWDMENPNLKLGDRILKRSPS